VRAAERPVAAERLELVLKARDELLRDTTRRAGPADVRRVVVIASSSRGGSSLLFSLLRSTGGFTCLQGEHAHLYKLYGLSGALSRGTDDGDVPADGDLRGFAHALVAEASVAEDGALPDPADFPRQAAARLVGQWPDLAPHAFDVLDVTVDALAAHDPRRSGRPFDADAYLLDVLRGLQERGMRVEAGYYDLAGGARSREGAPAGPPTGVQPVVEEPPFVVPRPARPAGPDDLRDRPLLLKAPVDAYRLPWLAELFPAADVRVVHLVRNPAAAVNGLVDGWLDRGFYSYDVSPWARLAIGGYSHLPWGAAWWNFDLPPGWREAAGLPLADVCALQWRSAHAEILAGLAATGLPALRLHAEDLMRAGPGRDRAVAEAARFAGVDAGLARAAAEPPPVMATAPPRPGRWRDRSADLSAVLADAAVRELAERLGYGRGPDARWI
jgi:hypothetical protein